MESQVERLVDALARVAPGVWEDAVFGYVVSGCCDLLFGAVCAASAVVILVKFREPDDPGWAPAPWIAAGLLALLSFGFIEIGAASVAAPRAKAAHYLVHGDE